MIVCRLYSAEMTFLEGKGDFRLQIIGAEVRIVSAWVQLMSSFARLRQQDKSISFLPGCSRA